MTSQQFQTLLQAFGIIHRTTPAYTPQCNPVEQANRTLKSMISQYVGKRHCNWDENIAALQFALNTARHEATGCISRISCTDKNWLTLTPRIEIHQRPQPTQKSTGDDWKRPSKSSEFT